jgi:hypothetical protein
LASLKARVNANESRGREISDADLTAAPIAGVFVV